MDKTAQTARARAFAELHVPGDPLVLFNIWDAGSAKAVAESGAKALATGSASLAGAQGYPDGEAIPLSLLFTLAGRIAESCDLPLSVDFEAGFAEDADALAGNVRALVEAGAIGMNFEDGRPGQGEIRDAEDQARRIAVARAAADEACPGFFINARTDLFLQAPAEEHSGLIDDALARMQAYAGAGASGGFWPGLADPELIARACADSPLPVNVMAYPGGPPKAVYAEAGAARISHGPFPWRAAMKRLSEEAQAAL